MSQERSETVKSEDRLQQLLGWVIGIGAVIVLLGLIFVVTTSAHAAPSAPSEVTVQDFRDFSEPVQIGYVVGFLAYSDLMGVGCPRKSVGEYRAAILHNRYAFKNDLRLNEAFFNFMVDSGCKASK